MYEWIGSISKSSCNHKIFEKSFLTKMKIVRDKGLITEQDPESDRLTGHPFHPWRARIADR